MSQRLCVGVQINRNVLRHGHTNHSCRDMCRLGCIFRSAPTWDDPRGFLLDGRVTHSRAAWGLRSLPAVRRAFADIWGTEELLVSMDTTIAWRPWWKETDVKASAATAVAADGGAGEGGRGASLWVPWTEGLHCDQNPFFKPDRCCVQGMVSEE